jgi:hypothetical protein
MVGVPRNVELREIKNIETLRRMKTIIEQISDKIPD